MTQPTQPKAEAVRGRLEPYRHGNALRLPSGTLIAVVSITDVPCTVNNVTAARLADCWNALEKCRDTIDPVTTDVGEMAGLLQRVIDECVENAGSDDPTFHPPTTGLLSTIVSALSKAKVTP